jgi:integrase
VAPRDVAEREPFGLKELSTAVTLLYPEPPCPDAPIGASPAIVRVWFDAALQAVEPIVEDTLDSERDAALAFASCAKAANTRRAYSAAVRAWCAWCSRRDRSPLPGSGADVAAFLASERGRGLAPPSLDLRRAAIRYLHHVAGCAVPTGDACVSATIAGIRRSAAGRGERPRKKKAATVQVLRRLLDAIESDIAGDRDRALLLVGFAGALRRSEIAGIRVEDLEHTQRGMQLTISQTKGSQTDAVIIPLPYGDTALCPVRALERWIKAASIKEGPVFRRIWRQKKGRKDGSPSLPHIGDEALSDRAIALIVQTRAVAAGFGTQELGGHSLKRGALTTGMDRGAHPARLKRLGRHKSFDVLGDYLEFGDLFEGHPLTGAI